MGFAAFKLVAQQICCGAWMTPYELVYQKVYQGRMTEFGEPAFAYTHTALKGKAKWQRVLVLGKTEAQDTYIVFTGSTVMLTRSIRRIATDWKCHLGFYLHFNAPTWQFKSGFWWQGDSYKENSCGKISKL